MNDTNIILFISDFNGHAGYHGDSYPGVHGDYVYSSQTVKWSRLLKFWDANKISIYKQLLENQPTSCSPSNQADMQAK